MTPTPGNPWPHDMTIRVQDDGHHVLELLWIRQAWGLAPAGADLPPLLVEPPARIDAEPAAVWTTAWPVVWDAVVEQEARAAELAGAYLSAPQGSPEQLHLLRGMIGRGWNELVGEGALTADYGVWELARFADRAHRSPRPLDEDPERVCLDALVPAWRAGLTTIIPIPCLGEHTRRIGAHALLVTESTRANPSRYRAALDSFAAASSR